MNKLIIIVGLLLPVVASATLITSSQSGNWGTSSTWVGGSIPGNGDTVNIFHVITDTDTRIIGTSPSSGTVVVTLNSTGTIHISSTGYLRLRGDVTYTANASTQDAVIIDGGGIWEFDSSQATGPTFQRYSFYPNNNFGYRTFIASGTSTSHAVLKTNASSGIGGLQMNGFAYGGGYTFYYADLSRMTFESYFKNDSEVLPHWDVTYSSFAGCGVITDPGGLSTGGTFKHEHNLHVNTVGGIVFNFQIGGFKSLAGIRSIQYNVFDSSMATNGGFADFTISNNFMGDIFENFYSSATYSNNFVRMRSDGVELSGNNTTSYFFIDGDIVNPHVINGFGSYAQISDGLIFGMAGRNSGDSGEFVLYDAATTSTRTVTHSIFLPNGNGYSPLEITSLLGNAQFTSDYEHNTYFGGASFNAAFGAMDYSETGNAPPGAISGFKNNITWNPELPGLTASYVKIVDIGNLNSDQGSGYGVGPTTDVCNPSNCDYNASYGSLQSTLTITNAAHYHNQGRGYIGNFSSTPGTHDIEANPSFLDYHRYAEAFDGQYYRPYRGLGTATAWSSGGSYSINDVVSHSTGTFYWGDSINYRYTNAVGCSSGNPEPGAGLLATWEPCWEFASLQDIRDGIISGINFTDPITGALNSNVIQALVLWVRAGYAPTNPAYHNTASDGTDIGAVPFLGFVQGSMIFRQ